MAANLLNRSSQAVSLIQVDRTSRPHLQMLPMSIRCSPESLAIRSSSELTPDGIPFPGIFPRGDEIGNSRAENPPRSPWGDNDNERVLPEIKRSPGSAFTPVVLQSNVPGTPEPARFPATAAAVAAVPAAAGYGPQMVPAAITRPVPGRIPRAAAHPALGEEVFSQVVLLVVLLQTTGKFVESVFVLILELAVQLAFHAEMIAWASVLPLVLLAGSNSP
eukprot:m.173261 g.173261  ORF g.173261 m.173261 type:complete len:219 (-) comp9951_c0_seq12:1451-2107(-)